MIRGKDNVSSLVVLLVVCATCIYQASVVRAFANAPTDDAAAMALSVSVSQSAFAFASRPLNTWLPSDSSYLRNDGTETESLVGSIGVFVAGLDSWTLSAATNGVDEIRAQWSIVSETGPWIDIAQYNQDFAITTGLAATDSVPFYFRIQTPTVSTSNSEYSSALTVTALASP